MPVQTVRGVVVDQVLGTPLEGVTVSLPAFSRTAVTDKKGAFRFSDVPIGTLQLLVTSIGYKDLTLDNIVLNSGKETVLTLSIENSVKVSDAIIIKANSKKNKPLNDMSAVSARAFTVEETQKYAAAVNDPLRMAAGFPGVFTTDDGTNSIAIRGNSPSGLLWRMEGIDIPNPNHFSSAATSGGGISILSAQLLSNSDFVTGAFAAEYGNALSGVFDLRLRKGNNEKKEYTLQAGLLGLNLAAEGPFMPLYKGSYLVNYRYSTLGLLSKLGVPVPGNTDFQDLSFNLSFPTKRFGNFSFFGFGGLSLQKEKAVKDSSKWESSDDRYTMRFVSNTAFSGITHSISLGDKTSLRSAIGYAYNRITDRYEYLQDDYSLRDDYEEKFTTTKWTLSSTVNHKFSSKSSLRSGLILGAVGFNYFERSRANELAPLLVRLDTKDRSGTVQGFAQWQYKPVDRLTVNMGLHYLGMLLNGTGNFEPRLSARYRIDPANSIAIGYGEHSQVQALGVYFAQVPGPSGSPVYPNKDLDLSKARHLVLSYQHHFNKTVSIKGEAYYQQLSKVPVSIYDTSSFSILNVEGGFVTDPLANRGKGRNYGVEISLERFLAKAFYYTLSTSLYRSKYTGADGIERNTKFNGKYLLNGVVGKEFTLSNRLKTFGVNIKTIYAGGLHRTPLDLEMSRQAGYAIYREEQAFSVQNDSYFRTDLRLSLKWNRRRLTSTLSLDIQNLTNRLNVAGEHFDSHKGQPVTSTQTGIIPILNYKVEF